MATPLSWKIVTTANCTYSMPFETQPIVLWNDTVGTPITATVEGIWGGGTLPNDDEIWLEVEYLADSSSRASFVHDGKANLLATPTAQTTSGAVWGAPTVTTWDTATAAGVTLSGGNLVATNTGTTSTDQGARVATAAVNGKYYLEDTYTTLSVGASSNSNYGVGIGAIGSTYFDIVNATTGCMTFRSGSIYSNGSSTGINFGNRAQGDVIGVAVDLDNRKIWFRIAPSGNWNNSGTANPATNVGGVTIPAGAMVPSCTFGGPLGTAGQTQTVNFGASAFVGAVPSGFTSGWPMVWWPFSLSTTFTPALPGWIYSRVKCARPSATFYIDPKVTLAAA